MSLQRPGVRSSKWERILQWIMTNCEIVTNGSEKRHESGCDVAVRIIEFITPAGVQMKLEIKRKPKLLKHQVIRPRKRPTRGYEIKEYSPTETVIVRELSEWRDGRWIGLNPEILEHLL